MKAYPIIEKTKLLRRIKHELIFPLHWLRFKLLPKQKQLAVFEHSERVLSSPDYQLIRKHPDTSKLSHCRLVMHNGLKVLPTAYFGYPFLARSRCCQTVDEPQEERLFQDLLPLLPRGSVMLELGSFWAFYSLWFHLVVPGAVNYMIEPDLKNLACGQTNFEINGFDQRINFTQALVDDSSSNDDEIPKVCVDDFCRDKNIERLTVLHADVQSYESRMLDGAHDYLSQQRIDYLFISTHSNTLHETCKSKLVEHGYRIVSDVNLDEAYQVDGVIFAALPNLPGVEISPVSKCNT